MVVILLSILLRAGPKEELFEFQPGLPEDLILKEAIEELMRNPLDLNRASKEELSKVPYLDPVLVDRIVQYRRLHGPFSTIDELSRVPGFDPDRIERVSPFLVIGAKEASASGHIRIRFRTEELPSRFLDQSFYSRANLHLGQMRLGGVVEKDPGESSPVDFYGLNLDLTHGRSRLLVGDYHLTTGQGLIFSAPFTFIAGPEPSLSIGRDELSPKLTPDENFGLRGLAWQSQFRNFRALLIASHTDLDARLNPDLTVAQILYDGVHDDSASCAARDQLKESLLGGRLAYHQESTRFGLSGYSNRYNRRIAPDDSVSSFYGDRLTLLGFDYAWLFGNYLLFGEAGHSLGNGWASILGLNGNLPPVRIGFNLQGYQARFFSPHGRSYSLCNREDRLDYHFSLWTRLADIRAGLYGSIGHDFEADSLVGRYTFSLSHRRRPFDISLKLKGSFQEEQERSRGSRVHLRWDGLKGLIFDIRVEDRYSLIPPIKRGSLGFFELWLDKPDFDLRARWYLFDIPSSRVAISAYEYAPAGLGRSRSFKGQGFRIFLMGSLNFRKALKAAIRYGYTKTDEVNSDLGIQLALTY